MYPCRQKPPVKCMLISSEPYSLPREGWIVDANFGLFWHQSRYAESDFSVSMDLVWGMMAFWRLEIYNLTLRIMSSLISSVFYSTKRCLFDFNNMTRLIRTRRWYGHFRSFNVRINGVLLYQTVKWCKCTREDLPFFKWEPRRKKGQKPVFR